MAKMPRVIRMLPMIIAVSSSRRVKPLSPRSGTGRIPPFRPSTLVLSADMPPCLECPNGCQVGARSAGERSPGGATGRCRAASRPNWLQPATGVVVEPGLRRVEVLRRQAVGERPVVGDDRDGDAGRDVHL